MKKLFPLACLIVLLLMPVGVLRAADLVTEDFTYTSSLDGTGPLYATVYYSPGASKLPVMLVMHGYWGKRANVEYSARRMAERGYFAVALDTRGWGGAAGMHDEGGLETMDIFDGLQAALAKYPGRTDPARVSIVGYSNGGANVFFSCVRFPYLFRGGLAFFGIPDYGQWIGLNPNFRAPVLQAMGLAAPADAPDRFVARSATLAAGNLISGLRLHIAYDEQEALCPIKMDDDFVAAAQAGGAPYVFVHVSKVTDKTRNTHGYNDNGRLSPVEDLFMDDIEKNQPAAPVMPDSGVLTVIGYLVTPKFTILVGSGENAAATVHYRCLNGAVRFTFSPLSSNPDAAAKVTLTGASGAYAVAAGTGTRQALAAGAPLQGTTTIASSVSFWPTH